MRGVPGVRFTDIHLEDPNAADLTAALHSVVDKMPAEARSRVGDYVYPIDQARRCLRDVFKFIVKTQGLLSPPVLKWTQGGNPVNEMAAWCASVAAPCSVQVVSASFGDDAGWMLVLPAELNVRVVLAAAGVEACCHVRGALPNTAKSSRPVVEAAQ